MKKYLKNILQKFLPPGMLRLFKPDSKYGWHGDYRDWESARNASTGYDQDLIMKKVSAAAEKVKNGEAAFERDGVLFYQHEYTWPVVSALMWVAAQNEGRLRVMDFGGALGSTYFQYKHLFNSLKLVNWCVVEQDRFCEVGEELFKDEKLSFYRDIESCVGSNQLDVILLGCVLPYIETPFDLLETIAALNTPFLIIDRIPFIENDKDRLTVQHVPPQIYEASYPAWFFSYASFMTYINKKYSVIAEYPCADRSNIPSAYRGLILKKK